MSKEQVNYADYTFDPNKPVLVPVSVYIAINNLIGEVEKQHTNPVQTDVYSFFHKETHQKLSAKGKAKMSQEKLQKEYYENIDLDETKKNTRIDRDPLGAGALQLLVELRQVFKSNVDQGNAILRSDFEKMMQGSAQETPSPLRVETAEENDS